MRQRADYLRLAVCVCLALGCGGSKKQPAENPRDLGRGHAPYPKSTLPKRTFEGSSAPSVPSYLVAAVPDKTVGPLLARHGRALLAAYLATTEGGIRRLVAVPLSADGAPGDPRVVTGTAPDSTTLVLREAGGGAEGFVAAWTELTDRGEALSVVGVGTNGAPAGASVEIARTQDDIVWVEIAPTAKGSVCMWAEQTRSGEANVLAVALEPNGKPRGVPSRVAKGVVGWQAVPSATGVGLAIVTAGGGKPAGVKAPRSNGLSWLRINADAQPIGSPAPVATSTAPIVDLDAARVGDGNVLAWTDRSGLDPQVETVLVDAQGKSGAAAPATARSGGAALAALAGGIGGGLLAWEETSKRAHAMRRLHLASLSAQGVVDAEHEVVLEIDGSVAPELTPAGAGYALLFRARPCADPARREDPPCEQAPWLPTFVRLDANRSPAQIEAVRLDDAHQPAALAWGLTCDDDRCAALAARNQGRRKAPSVAASPPA